MKKNRSLLDMGAWINEAAGGENNIHFIAANDPVSTYDLLKTTRVLLPHTSTIALEAAMQNIPTVLGTSCYYEGFGFAWSAQTETEFHNLIEAAVTSQLTFSADAAWNARLLYFLTQSCAPLRTAFTPTPKDLFSWVVLSPEILWEQKELKLLKRTLSEKMPLSYLQAIATLSA